MATKSKIEPPEDLDSELEELDRRMERLRVIYEQYFLGIEKRPPQTQQREVARRIRLLSSYHVRNTGHKFRLQALIQRFNVHRAYWVRSCRAIEEGTYTRHRLKAERRSLVKGGERLNSAELAKRALLRELKGGEAVEARRNRQAEAAQSEGDPQEANIPAVARRRTRRGRRASAIRGKPAEALTGATAPVNAGAPGEASTAEPKTGQSPQPGSVPTAAAQVPTAGAAPASSSAAAATQGWSESSKDLAGAADVLSRAGISETRARSIYDTLIDARERSGESNDKLSFDRIVRSMAKQVPKLQETHRASAVDFDVVSKNNRVYLKPVPK